MRDAPQWKGADCMCTHTPILSHPAFLSISDVLTTCVRMSTWVCFEKGLQQGSDSPTILVFDCLLEVLHTSGTTTGGASVWHDWMEDADCGCF